MDGKIKGAYNRTYKTLRAKVVLRANIIVVLIVICFKQEIDNNDILGMIWGIYGIFVYHVWFGCFIGCFLAEWLSRPIIERMMESKERT